MSPQIDTEYHAEDSRPHQNVGRPWVAGAFLIDNFLEVVALNCLRFVQ
jgi:hypothetical protein